MISWEKINSVVFEELAYDYMVKTYPELNWVSTKRTRDGNKDGIAKYTGPLNVTIKYWYEAKYSKNISKCIAKSHLDSTLVSCMLDGHVVKIAFITNAYISEDYRRRADVFAKQCDNLKIIYVNGEELENWLYENPDIETKYFLTNNAKYKRQTDHIDDACILQNYDVNGKKFAKVKSVESGKEYVLYLSFYSTIKQTVSLYSKNDIIKVLNQDNRKYDQFDSLRADKGLNSFYIPVVISNNLNETLKFTVFTANEEINFEISDIIILNIYNPVIQYKSQIDIQNYIFRLINIRDITNSLIYIVGNAGDGKSFLLNNIYQNSINPFTSYVFKFIGDELTDTLTCYKIIISSLYGEIWEYTSAFANIQSFSEIEIEMLDEINNLRVNGGSIKQVTQYFKNLKGCTEQIVAQRQIFIDDYYKLSDNLLLLMEEYQKWFIRQRLNCRLFVFTRAETRIPLFCTKKMTISPIQVSDVKATMQTNFPNATILPNLAVKYRLPLNALHFVNLVCKIREIEPQFQNKTELEVNLLLNSIYSDSDELTFQSLGNQLIAQYARNKIAYCVYKLKTGISLDALYIYFNSEEYDQIYLLCQKKVLLQSGNFILPYHDILASAYSAFHFDDLDALLEDFTLFAEENHFINQSQMFSTLIGIGKQCFWKYKNEASQYRDKLHSMADYSQALEIAKQIRDNNSKSIDKYDLEDCENQFVLANCIKYTNSYEDANREFSIILENYEITQNPDVYGIYLEAETEIINNLIWMLNVKAAKKRLDKLAYQFVNLYLMESVKGHHIVYAFLNYYNRLMFVNFMLDVGSKEDYFTALHFSQEFGRTEYEAFAKIDYAKSIYGTNLVKAYDLIHEAIPLLNEKTEKRRILDALSEECFISDVLNDTISYNVYSDIEIKMRQNHYVQSQIKIKLKQLALQVLSGAIPPEEIRNQLKSIVVNNSSILSGKRHQVYINHLYAASYYLETNFGMSKKYSLKCCSLLREFGISYKRLHQINSNLTDMKGFVKLNEWVAQLNSADKFILDIRLW